jgi:TolB-like protein
MRALLALIVLAAAPAAAQDRCKAAVLDLTPGAGVSAKRATALTEVVTKEVGEHLACDVLGKSEIASLISFEAEKQAAGCADDDCMAEIGDALGVKYLITGDLAEVDGAVLLSMRMMDLERTKVVERVTESYLGKGRGLISFVGWAARKLVAEDEAVIGPRPDEDPGHVMVERRPTVWRQLAWGGVATTAALGVISGGLGGTALGMSLSLPNLKTARQPDVDLINSLEDTGPALASGSNIAFYAALLTGAVTVGLFFAPGEEMSKVSE